MGITVNFNQSDIDDPSTAAISDNLKLWGYQGIADDDPIGYLFHPVFDSFDSSSETVGLLVLYVHWRRLFVDILPANAKGIVAVIETSCEATFSYRIDGIDVDYLGPGDYHDNRFNHMKVITYLSRDFNEKKSRFYSGADLNNGNCDYILRVYPSTEMEEEYKTNDPLIYTVGAISIFLFTALLFLAYDFYVERRQKLVMKNVMQSGSILASLFPSNIRDQLMKEQENSPSKKGSYMSNNHRVQSFLHREDEESRSESGALEKPIADLFLETTVLFADVANFTSWSSTRDAGQVFQLLQAIFQSFDSLAKRRRVFKVETVGDCYGKLAGAPFAHPGKVWR